MGQSMGDVTEESWENWHTTHNYSNNLLCYSVKKLMEAGDTKVHLKLTLRVLLSSKRWSDSDPWHGLLANQVVQYLLQQR